MLVSFPYNGHAVPERAGGGKEPVSHSLPAALGGAGLEVLTFDVTTGLGARVQTSL